VLILSGTVAALTLTGTSAPTAVALEPLATPGANPFMPPVGIPSLPSFPLRNVFGRNY